MWENPRLYKFYRSRSWLISDPSNMSALSDCGINVLYLQFLTLPIHVTLFTYIFTKYDALWPIRSQLSDDTYRHIMYFSCGVFSAFICFSREDFIFVSSPLVVVLRSYNDGRLVFLYSTMYGGKICICNRQAIESNDISTNSAVRNIVFLIWIDI
jgi:hypothetical protein